MQPISDGLLELEYEDFSNGRPSLGRRLTRVPHYVIIITIPFWDFWLRFYYYFFWAVV